MAAGFPKLTLSVKSAGSSSARFPMATLWFSSFPSPQWSLRGSLMQIRHIDNHLAGHNAAPRRQEEFYTKVQFQNDLALYAATRTLALQRCALGEISGMALNRVAHKIDALEITARAKYAANGRIFAALRRAKAMVARLEARDTIPGPEYKMWLKKRNYLKMLVAKILEGTTRPEEEFAEAIAPEPQETLPWTKVRRLGGQLEIEFEG